MKEVLPLYEEVNPEAILVEESPFYLEGCIFKDEESSSENAYIIRPPLLYRDRNSKLHLLDGTLKDPKAKIGALVIASVPEEMVFLFLLDIKREIIFSSAINRLLYLKKAHDFLKDEKTVQTLAPLLKLPGNEPLVEIASRLTGLPIEVRRFLHGRRFSYRQIKHLMVVPEGILSTLVDWQHTIHLTARVFEEFALVMRECLLRDEMELEEFVDETGIKEILLLDLPPRRKTEMIRDVLERRRYPSLTEINQKIEGILREMNLPEGIQIDWDRTLEERGIKILLRVRDPEDLRTLLQRLGSCEMEKPLKEIFRLL